MKPDIHPAWYPEATVVCACGTTFTVGATAPSIHTEICSACHPFFTGEQRIVDTAGQVERFMRRLQVGVDQRVTKQSRAEARADAERQAREAKRERRGVTALEKSIRAGDQAADETPDDAEA